MESTAKSVFDWRLAIEWTLATTVAAGAGAALGWTLGVLLFPRANPVELRNATMILALSLTTGLAQWLVLRGRIPRAALWLASVLGAGIVYSILSAGGLRFLTWAVTSGPLADTFAGIERGPALQLWWTLLLSFIGLLGFFAIVGEFVIQWLLLRAVVQRAWVWLLANTVSTAVGLVGEILFFTRMPVANLVGTPGAYRPGDWSALVTGVPLSFATALIPDAIIGLVLAWLFSRPKSDPS